MLAFKRQMITVVGAIALLAAGCEIEFSDETEELETTEQAVGGETYQAIAYWFYNSFTGLKAHYQCSQSTSSGANSQQIWCDVSRKGCSGSTWYEVANLWKSRWGDGSLVVGGEQGTQYGCHDLRTKGTHLFDYGANNWVWKYSQDSERYDD